MAKRKKRTFLQKIGENPQAFAQILEGLSTAYLTSQGKYSPNDDITPKGQKDAAASKPKPPTASEILSKRRKNAYLK